MTATMLELSLTREQDELRAMLRDFMSRKSAVTAARRMLEEQSGYDAELWAQMRDQLAVPGLTLPEEHGGQGFTTFEQQILLEEMGRELHTSQYLASSVLAATALQASDDAAACEEYLPRIADGTLSATYTAFAARRGPVVTASHEGDRTRLRGEARFVLDGATAELLLVNAEGDYRTSLYAVDVEATGLVCERLPTMDGTRPMARLLFDGVPARLVGTAGGGQQIADRVRVAAVAALTAEGLGGSSRCLEIAVEHAKTREQFGRVIGSFQAIKHKAADMLIQIEASRSAVTYLSRLLSRDDVAQPVGPSVQEAAAVAAIVCSEAYVSAAKQTIQTLGGIGYTWEHDAHLYLKRAKASQLLLGSPLELRNDFAALAGVGQAGGF